jgi:DNA-binding beta-propeller fold protein YncE
MSYEMKPVACQRSMDKFWMAVVLTCAAFLSGVVLAEAGAALPLRTVADIPLSGHPTRLDYQTYDATRHLLFIAHLGDNAVTVVNTETQREVAAVPGIEQVHGVLAIPELGRVYATATGAHQVVTIDEERFNVVGTVPGESYPDGLAYVPPAHKLYVSDKAGAAVVIDVQSNQRIGAIALGSEIGNIQ